MTTLASKSIRGAVAGLILVVGFVVALPSVASAAPCVIDEEYSGGPTITTDPSGTVEPGDTIDIIGTGFPPNCEVDIVIDGTVVGTVTTTSDGTFTFPFTIPTSFLGSLTIIITAGEFSQTITLQVAQPTTTTQQPLTPTGSDSAGVAGFGVALVAAGGLLVLLARKRREAVTA
jgi:hypothetical protein